MSKDENRQQANFGHSKATNQHLLMNVVLWVIQGLLALAFFYSGLMKSTRSEQTLVAMGMTGVEHLPLSLIRFIGISELAGATGLILPLLLNQLPVLTPLSALCLGLIMIPAAIIHYRRGEPKTVGLNGVFFVLCVLVAYSRWIELTA
ncbi:DoxX family protein [Spirosoma arcticum]